MDGLSVQLMLRNGSSAARLSNESAVSSAEKLLFGGSRDGSVARATVDLRTSSQTRAPTW